MKYNFVACIESLLLLSIVLILSQVCEVSSRTALGASAPLLVPTAFVALSAIALMGMVYLYRHQGEE